MANIQMTGPLAGAIHINGKDYKPSGGVYSIPQELEVEAIRSGLTPMAAISKNTTPVAGVDILPGDYKVWKNTGDGSVKLYYNDGGTLKSVALA